MPGIMALVGAGEFVPAMAEFDEGLLAATGRKRPRVVVLPTAWFPSGEDAFQRCAVSATEHFRGLGAEVEPVLVRDRWAAEDAAAIQAVGEADLIYLSGGRSSYLLSVLAGSGLGRALADAHDRGAVLAGSAAGAMVLAARQPEFRRRAVPWPLRWRSGLGLVPDAAILPDYDRWPEPFMALMALQAPRGSAVLGIDDGTAIVGRDGAWQVYGRARVTVWRGRHRERFRRGDVFRL